MLTDFDRLCIFHGCAEFMRGTDRWCPMADDVRRETGRYPFPAKCRKIYNRLHNIEPEEGEDKANDHNKGRAGNVEEDDGWEIQPLV